MTIVLRVIASTVVASTAAGCGSSRAEDSARSPTAALASPSSHGVVITRRGSQPSSKGSAENFTGAVLIEPLFQATEHTRAAGASVTFEPGARTAWHSHPAGQTLIVTSGTGWVQEWGGTKQEIGPGDVVWTPPGVKHWHGATTTEAMTHIAIQEHVDGKVVDWMEHVGDEQYRGEASMKIGITVDGKVIEATLIDSEATRDFVSLLPLTLEMGDLFKREKFARLPRAISERGERARAYEVGDVVYWPPGPDLAIFYRHDGQPIPEPGIIVLGKVSSGVNALNVSGPVTVNVDVIR
jgi:quercetin dioxygenase-like cupin family protein